MYRIFFLEATSYFKLAEKKELHALSEMNLVNKNLLSFLTDGTPSVIAYWNSSFSLLLLL